MKKMMRKFAAAVLGLCLLISGLWMAPVQADASGGDGWVGAWSTSPVEFNLKKMLDMEWIKCDLGLRNLTFRTRLQPTISGEDVRITLSNEFGTGPLTIDTASVAKGYEKLPQAIKTWTRKNVTFNGQSSVTIPVGETVTSDPVGMSVDALEYSECRNKQRGHPSAGDQGQPPSGRRSRHPRNGLRRSHDGQI